ncbi:MAG: AtpZ/AtpI family protein [Sporomusaceae bacterium]|nr:AtpZ/AtpI family protein [Sporomusaceae bacterium]
MQKGNKDSFSGLNTAATISGYMISSVVVGIVLGRWADEYFGSQPWATIAGIVLGMITGMWATYKKVSGGI